MTPFSPLKVNSRFEGTIADCFTLVSCLDYSSSLKMEATFSPKSRLALIGRLGGISQKIKLDLGEILVE
jgi:hypothetical protein